MASSCVYFNDVKRTAFTEEIMVMCNVSSSEKLQVNDFIQVADSLCNPIINHHNGSVLNWFNYAKTCQ